MRSTNPCWLARALPVLVPVLLVTLWCGSAGAQQALVPRQVAAAPEDIVSGLVRLPDPATVGISSRTAWQRARFEAGPDGGWIARLVVPVGRPEGRVVVLPIGPGSERWQLELRRPDGTRLALGEELAAGRAQQHRVVLDTLAPGFEAVATELERVPGLWEVTLHAPAGPGPGPGQGRPRAEPPQGYLMTAEPGSSVLESHLGTHALLAGDTIPVRARLDAAAAVTSMALHVRGAGEGNDGDLVLPMADDGLHDDGQPGDGLWGALLPPRSAGQVFAQVVATGTGTDGLPLLRTAEHVFTLIERSAVLTGEVDAAVLDDTRLRLSLGAWVFGEPGRLHVSTEVWGTDETGTLVPVCWLSSMVDAAAGTDPTAGETALPLALDVRWLNRVGASAPLELRHLRVQDPRTGIPVDTLPRVRLESVPMPLVFGAPPGPVLADMTMGPSPLLSAPRVSGASTQVGGMASPFTRGLVLSHGYCSSGNIWPMQHFTGNVLQFVDADSNRSHDEFAQLLGAYGAPLDSFGLLAHSQGGNAGLHLYTYYESGLDHAKGGRLIQAVATPWLGSPLASSLAGLGGIFGIGCGANDDLSSSGAAVWLSGIPSWARAEVSYWTTQNSGSACNGLTNLFLSSPNDGVVERSKGQLTGATNMGHITGWCHSTGMSNPPNYTDATRNAERNAAAAR